MVTYHDDITDACERINECIWYGTGWWRWRTVMAIKSS